jgi:hypothetical protein
MLVTSRVSRGRLHQADLSVTHEIVLQNSSVYECGSFPRVIAALYCLACGTVLHGAPCDCRAFLCATPVLLVATLYCLACATVLVCTVLRLVSLGPVPAFFSVRCTGTLY